VFFRIADQCGSELGKGSRLMEVYFGRRELKFRMQPLFNRLDYPPFLFQISSIG